MPQKVLIVDDDEPTRAGLAMRLRDAGYDTLTAGSVPAAIKLLSENPPDLLLVDIRLDAYNGLHVVAMRPQPIPAIVMTGFADSAIEADARRLGAEFLLKPVSPNVLRTLIGRLLAVDSSGAHPRRWPRKTVADDIHLTIDDAEARVIDVSYGGVCVEVRPSSGSALPNSFQIVFPLRNVSVPVEVVWARRRDASTWLCGGVIAEESAAQWREVVDTLATSQT